MNSTSATYISSLQQQLQNRVDPQQLGTLKTFAELLWARAVEEDLAQRSISDDAGGTIEAFRILNETDPKEVGIHLLNPHRGRDGWQSSFSVVIVTAPNMPFMVDSVLMALSHDGLATHHLNNVVMGVERDGNGHIIGIEDDVQHINRELLIYAEIDRLDDAAFEPLRMRLNQTAIELSAAVADFPAMKERLDSMVEDLTQMPPPIDKLEVEEGIAFLQWLKANHFTFLGCRKFEYVNGVLKQVGEALGLQRVRPPASERLLAEQPERTQRFLMSAKLLSFSKSGTKSRVHRPA